MSSGASLSDTANSTAVDGHLSGPECDLIAAAAARLACGYQVQLAPGNGFFAWCSVIPAPGRSEPTFSLCRYGASIMLLIKDSEGHKTVATSGDLRAAISAMAAAAFSHLTCSKPPSSQQVRAFH